MISNYESKINQLLGKKSLLEKQLSDITIKYNSLSEKLPSIEKAQALIQDVANKTQSQLKLHIEDIVNAGLETVFPETYICQIDFVTKRNKTECDIYLLDNYNNRVNPLEDNGGGLSDIVSFCLRLAVWTISNTDNVLLLDEPFKFLSRDLLQSACDMLKELTEKLGLQIVMVTHLEEFINISDKVFIVKKINDISKILEV